MLMRTSSPCAGSNNIFLSHLSPQDAACIDGLLERVVIEPGTLLSSIGAPTVGVYFPETIIVSVGTRVPGGQHVETAIIGYEGIVGWTAFAGIKRASFDAVVQMKRGTALRLSPDDAARACETHPSLLVAIARYADVMEAQMAKAIVSVGRDDMERRISRWLLMRHDRTTTDLLVVRHDEISASLGVRRASVTDALHILEGLHLVRCRRGRIIIRDRIGLERVAGPSYGAAETYYRDHIGAFGRSSPQIAWCHKSDPTPLHTNICRIP